MGLSAVPVPLEALEWVDPGTDWLILLICRPSSASKLRTFCMAASSSTPLFLESTSNLFGDDASAKPKDSVVGNASEVGLGTNVLLVRDRFA
jgi:hypothetical protein